MATTDPTIATDLLAGLERLGVRYAILHREEDVAQERIKSDVDVVVDRPCAEVLERLVAEVADLTTARPIMIWPYDEGSLTTFWLRPDCAAGLQLDLMHDPAGRGRYGLRTNAALQHVVQGQRWVKLDATAERIYLIAKRGQKRNCETLETLVSDAGSDVLRTYGQILSPAAARRFSRAIRGRKPSQLSGVRELARRLLSTRYARRIINPVGVHISVEADDEFCERAVMAEIRQRLSRVLVAVRVVDGPAVVVGMKLQFWKLRPTLLLTGRKFTGGAARLSVGPRGFTDVEADALHSVLWNRVAAQVRHG